MVKGLLGGLGGVAALGLQGCASQQIEQYANEKPALDLRTYFNGVIDAYGVFTDRSGAVVKRFSVVMQCQWNGAQGVLDEDFVYSDGTVQKRIWRLTQLPDGRYTGVADDVVGTAQGRAMGNAFNWQYTLRLPVDGSVYEVQFDDWMYLMNEQVMLNKATMSKFGVRLGEVTLSFNKRKP
ncbi:DUF3833 domain-containing protein [Curvibacter sp. CHRR-16]|uniref:DUF3833 domain-containing protein n=1 Tax=Curvibacter sp. CHRR-16 TaxID=2835872 RepID=UPI001BD9CD7D|nr:DUF3833 domain-containing protein [Curvibacter sp. CHRR-16]MBT0571093.1 DUF3833 domain-containing protein [Curvibacter sp. CHRR-16]